MFASRKTRALTLSDGSVVSIRPLNQHQLKHVLRLMEDRTEATDKSERRRAGDEADDYVLLNALVALPEDRPITDETIRDITGPAMKEIVEAVMRESAPDLFVPDPIEAAKNDSGPSTAISTATGQSPTSGM